MKKIPTLFTRVFERGRIVGNKDEITPGCEEAFLNGVATIKIDGSCCAVIDGELYRRFDAKRGRKIPKGAIPCCDPDPITGHWPHWVKVDPNNSADKWFVEAFNNTFACMVFSNDSPYLEDATYEAVGPHFNGNPYCLSEDKIVRHGIYQVNGLERNFESIREFLMHNREEGLVFWLDGEPVCKIKRTDFGFKWPN